MTLNLDGTGKSDIHTGIGFFDHMLDGFARHGLFDLSVSVDGDLDIDGHHTIEDTGIVLGTAIREAVGDKQGIRRYGDKILPMDETLVLSAVDLCGRPYLSFQAEFTREKVGEMETEMVKEFFYAVSYAAQMNLRLGKMTYWSRSRNELWTKGLSSGHVQYVKQLLIDCDNDTILAKVEQVGAACHTGNRTCFYRTLAE